MPDLVWVVGPIAWDWVYTVPTVPAVGGFVQSTGSATRPGGSGANLARNFRTLSVPVCMVGYVGADEPGRQLLTALNDADIGTAAVEVLPGVTSQVIILVDGNGERTMVGIAPDQLDKVTWPIDKMGGRDTLVLAAWHDCFASAVTAASAVVREVLTVPFTATEVPVPADVVIGSVSQLTPAAAADPFGYYARATAGRCRAVIVTSGADPVRVCTASGTSSTAVPVVPVVDATGAGDAFLAAFVAATLRGQDISEAVAAGVLLGSRAVQLSGSALLDDPAE